MKIQLCLVAALCAASVASAQKLVIKGSDTTRRNDWHSNRITHTAREIKIETFFGSVTIH